MPITPDHVDEWISITRAAKLLGVTSRSIRRYTAAGKLPDVRSPGGHRIFRVRDIEAARQHRGPVS